MILSIPLTFLYITYKATYKLSKLASVFTKAEAFEYGDEEELFAWLDVAMNANERT